MDGLIIPRADLERMQAERDALLAAAKEMMRQDAVQRATHNSNPFMAHAADRLGAAIRKAEGR